MRGCSIGTGMYKGKGLCSTANYHCIAVIPIWPYQLNSLHLGCDVEGCNRLRACLTSIGDQSAQLLATFGVFCETASEKAACNISCRIQY